MYHGVGERGNHPEYRAVQPVRGDAFRIFLRCHHRRRNSATPESPRTRADGDRDSGTISVSHGAGSHAGDSIANGGATNGGRCLSGAAHDALTHTCADCSRCRYRCGSTY